MGRATGGQFPLGGVLEKMIPRIPHTKKSMTLIPNLSCNHDVWVLLYSFITGSHLSIGHVHDKYSICILLRSSSSKATASTNASANLRYSNHSQTWVTRVRTVSPTNEDPANIFDVTDFILLTLISWILGIHMFTFQDCQIYRSHRGNRRWMNSQIPT